MTLGEGMENAAGDEVRGSLSTGLTSVTSQEPAHNEATMMIELAQAMLRLKSSKPWIAGQ